ncbi:hypothetical protein HGRIS_006259 [Hohenbuehelia grisea]|uniref:Uncharacterized protein n=1 Tax=Hohenbuehelia grisea TaxID=104357 RepID=A0ABR3K1T8_9AGAR
MATIINSVLLASPVLLAGQDGVQGLGISPAGGLDLGSNDEKASLKDASPDECTPGAPETRPAKSFVRPRPPPIRLPLDVHTFERGNLVRLHSYSCTSSAIPPAATKVHSAPASINNNIIHIYKDDELEGFDYRDTEEQERDALQHPDSSQNWHAHQSHTGFMAWCDKEDVILDGLLTRLKELAQSRGRSRAALNRAAVECGCCDDGKPKGPACHAHYAARMTDHHICHPELVMTLFDYPQRVLKALNVYRPGFKPQPRGPIMLKTITKRVTSSLPYQRIPFRRGRAPPSMAKRLPAVSPLPPHVVKDLKWANRRLIQLYDREEREIKRRDEMGTRGVYLTVDRKLTGNVALKDRLEGAKEAARAAVEDSIYGMECKNRSFKEGLQKKLKVWEAEMRKGRLGPLLERLMKKTAPAAGGDEDDGDANGGGDAAGLRDTGDVTVLLKKRIKKDA